MRRFIRFSLALALGLLSVAALADPLPGVKPPPPPARPLPYRGSPPPPYGGPVTTPPAIIPLPAPVPGDDLLRNFHRDQVQTQVDTLRQQDAAGQLDPLGQRERMRRELELHQLGGDSPSR